MAVWDDTITERDRQVYDRAGYGGRRPFGQRPALIVIDVNYAFVGDEPEPILESIKKYHNSCGEEGWAGVHQIAQALAAAREKNVPVFYSTGRPKAEIPGWGATKNVLEENDPEDHGNQIVAEIAPRPGDVVIRKDKASVFFGTPLIGYLVSRGIDTLLVTGCTTSGCVRATAVDAHSYNLNVKVLEEAVFDRGEASHKINLFDLNAKYADVIPVADAIEYLRSLPAREPEAARVRAPGRAS